MTQDANLQLVAEFQMDGCFVSANQAFYDAFGYASGELDGRHHSLFVPPEEAGSTEYKTFWLALNHGGFQVGEFKRLRKDGSEVWLLATYTPVLDPNGTPLKVVKLAVDITETIANRSRIEISEARTRAILESAIDGIITIDEDGIVKSFNPAAERLFGYTADEIIGENVDLLVQAENETWDSQHFRNRPGAHDADIVGQGRQIEGRRKDGMVFAMELSVSEMDVGGRRMFTGIARDITERQRAGKEMARLNADLSERVAALDAMNEINDLLYRMNGFFQAAESQDEINAILTKYAQALFKREIGAFFSITNGVAEQAVTWGGDYAAETDFTESACWALRQGEPKVTDNPNDLLICEHLKDTAFAHAICCPVNTRDGAVGLLTVYATESDSDDAEALQQRMERNGQVLTAIAERLGAAIANLRLRVRLRQDSIRDPLTKLYNRRFFDETLELEVRRAGRSDSPISILLLDIDHFKSFNDNHGHDAGDKVLQVVAEILQNSCRQEDIPCRYGGEEFALVLTNLGKEMAAEKAEQVRHAVENVQVEYDGKPLPSLTISCGVAAIPEDAENQTDCLKLADDALYAAKGGGRNRVVVANSS